MIELDEAKFTLQSYKQMLKEVGDSLDLENKERKIEELSGLLESPGFWDNADRAQAATRELNELKTTVDGYRKLERQYQDIGDLIEMGNEENDPEIVPEIQADLAAFTEELEALRLETLLSSPYDKENAILTLHAGAGGTESCDWAGMLYRMYQKWA